LVAERGSDKKTSGNTSHIESKRKRKRAFYSDDEDGNENPQVGGRSNEENNALERQKTIEVKKQSGFHESKTWTSAVTGRRLA